MEQHNSQCESQQPMRQTKGWFCIRKPGPQVIKLCSCSTQLSMTFIMLINVKMPTIVGILTFISMVNITSEDLKARSRNFQHFKFYEQMKFHSQLS